MFRWWSLFTSLLAIRGRERAVARRLRAYAGPRTPLDRLLAARPGRIGLAQPPRA